MAQEKLWETFTVGVEMELDEDALGMTPREYATQLILDSLRGSFSRATVSPIHPAI